MNKIRLIAFIMSLALLLCGASAFSVLADEPLVAENPTAAEPEIPTTVYQEPVTEPSQPVEPTATAPVETVAPTTVPTPTTAWTGPGEDDDGNSYSDGSGSGSGGNNPYANNEIKETTPPEVNWNDIDEEEVLKLKDLESGDGNDFNFIKNNNSSDDDNSWFLILGIVMVFLSVVGFAFVILYRPNKKSPSNGRTPSGKASSGKSSSEKSSSGNHYSSHSRDRRKPSDYDDGY